MSARLEQVVPVIVPGTQIALLGWITGRRAHKNILFWDLVTDHNQTIKVVVEHGSFTRQQFDELTSLRVESSIRVTGIMRQVDRDHQFELRAETVKVVSASTGTMSPGLREDFDIFDPRYADHVLQNRHLYLRHPKLVAIMRFRSTVMRVMRRWFDKHGIIEFTAPVLTPVPLYEDRTAISFKLAGDAADQDPIFLTQCVGYYLEAAAHAVGAVYNMGPSFRGERSKSRRHLMEYWHVKAELPDGDLETIMAFTENLVSTTIEACREEGERVAALLGTSYACKEGEPPYQRIGYREAIAFLQEQGHQITFGEGISGDGEVELGKLFDGPFWIVGNPRTIEPFPYVIDPNDLELTRTADLISPEGFGELLGTAEKIIDIDMLDERMREKGKADDSRYAWIREMREFGMVPHTAFGMGLERFLRWLLGASHVRDTIPFPRLFHRPVYP